MADFAISQIAPDFIRTLLFFSDFYKFGIKISGRCGGFSWCTLIYTIFSSIWNILTFSSGKKLFWRVYFNQETTFKSDLQIISQGKRMYLFCKLRWRCIIIFFWSNCSSVQCLIHNIYALPSKNAVAANIKHNRYFH